MRLQKRNVVAAELESSRYVLWNDKLGGFGLRVEPSGVKNYIVRYGACGGSRTAPLPQLSIARHGEMTPEKARREAEMALASVRFGAVSARQRAEVRQGSTLRDFADLLI